MYLDRFKTPTRNFELLLPPSIPEKAIIRLLDGDEDARRELIQLSYDRLRKLARKMLSCFPTVKRWEETDDVFQRSALRLWKSLEEVRPTDSRHYFNLAAMQVRRELIELVATDRISVAAATVVTMVVTRVRCLFTHRSSRSAESSGKPKPLRQPDDGRYLRPVQSPTGNAPPDQLPWRVCKWR